MKSVLGKCMKIICMKIYLNSIREHINIDKYQIFLRFSREWVKIN